MKNIFSFFFFLFFCKFSIAQSLVDQVLHSVSHDERLLVKEANAKAALHRLKQAESYLYPQAAISANNGRAVIENKDILDYSITTDISKGKSRSYSYKLNLNYPLFDKYSSAALKVSRAEYQSALFDYEAKKVDLYYEYAKKISTHVVNSVRLARALDVLDIFNKRIDLIHAADRAGIINAYNIDKIEILRLQVERNVRVRRRESEISMVDLDRLFKKPVCLAAKDFVVGEILESGSNPADVRNSFKVMSLQSAVDAATESILQQKALALPKIEVKSYIEKNYNSLGDNALTGSDRLKAFAGIEVSLPLFTGFNHEQKELESISIFKSKQEELNSLIADSIFRLKSIDREIEGLKSEYSELHLMTDRLRRIIEKSDLGLNLGYYKHIDLFEDISTLRIYEDNLSEIASKILYLTFEQRLYNGTLTNKNFAIFERGC